MKNFTAHALILDRYSVADADAETTSRSEFLQRFSRFFNCSLFFFSNFLDTIPRPDWIFMFTFSMYESFSTQWKCSILV